MQILQRPEIRGAFLCVEADRDALYEANVVDRGLLIEVGQCDLRMVLVHVDRCDRRRDLLHDRQLLLEVGLVRPVDKLLQL